jgi:hypothetical protein
VHTEFRWKSQKERDQQGDLDIGVKILGWNLQEQDGAVWTVLFWLRIGTSGGFL